MLAPAILTLFQFAATLPQTSGEWCKPVLVNVTGKVTINCMGIDPRALDVLNAELARANAQMKAGLLMALESSGARIEQLARQMITRGRPIPLDELVARVDAVTVESARAAGRALIARGKLATAVLGLGSGLESAAAIAETLTRRAAA